MPDDEDDDEPEQLSLDDIADEPHARPSDPDTSHAAYRSINVSDQAARVLRAYAGGRSLLDVEAYAFAGFGPNARDGQRCSDLRKAGFIVRTGQRRRTPSNKNAHVCQITGKGIQYLRGDQ